jgi:pantothenate kinase-related protein Tda10
VPFGGGALKTHDEYFTMAGWMVGAAPEDVVFARAIHAPFSTDDHVKRVPQVNLALKKTMFKIRCTGLLKYLVHFLLS